MICIREPLARALLRGEGRRGRRRLCAGRADGGHQPPFHRRFPRHRRRQQSARGDDRQPRLLGQQARHRHPPRHLAPRRRHERPRAPLDRHLARRRRQRLPARGRLRHHRGLRGHGDLLPRHRPCRPPAAAGPDPDRPDAGQEGRHRQRPVGGGLDGGAAQGRARAEPGADAREQPGLHPWRPVRQYRAWLQLGDRHQGRAQARRLCGHRGGLRRRSRRREILRHQMPQGRPQARLRGDRGHHPRAQDAWRRGQGRSQEGESRRAGEGLRQSRAPCRECAEIRRAGGGLGQPLLQRHRGRDRAAQAPLRDARRRNA